MDMDDWAISCIIPDRLFLGTRAAAESEEVLKQYGIQSVLSLTTDEVDVPSFIKERKWVCIEDYGTERVSDHFESCFEFIDNSTAPVLVHCEAGMSRSATIVIAYMMSKGKTLEEAYDETHKKREIIAPNNGFWFQLYQYALRLGEDEEELETFIYNMFGRKRHLFGGYYSVYRESQCCGDQARHKFVTDFVEAQFLWGNYFAQIMERRK